MTSDKILPTSTNANGRAEVLANARQVASDGLEALDRVEGELAHIAEQVEAAQRKLGEARRALEQVGAAASAPQTEERSHG